MAPTLPPPSCRNVHSVSTTAVRRAIFPKDWGGAFHFQFKFATLGNILKKMLQ